MGRSGEHCGEHAGGFLDFCLLFVFFFCGGLPRFVFCFLRVFFAGGASWILLAFLRSFWWSPFGRQDADGLLAVLGELEPHFAEWEVTELKSSVP